MVEVDVLHGVYSNFELFWKRGNHLVKLVVNNKLNKFNKQRSAWSKTWNKN